MKNTVVTKLGPGRIVEIKKMPDGSLEILQFVDDTDLEVTIPAKDAVEERMLILVEASKLSMEDDFMKHEPRGEFERKFKAKLTKVINTGIADFYRPKVDPSFDEEGRGIRYKGGEAPAVGRSYIWWENNARAFCPERNSRLGTEEEYIAFLGFLMKTMLESGKHIETVWNIVCYDSKELGHYWDSKNSKREFENTGSRCICNVFYDLANTYKVLASNQDNGSFAQAGGAYCNFSEDKPIFSSFLSYDVRRPLNNSVGWIVMD